MCEARKIESPSTLLICAGAVQRDHMRAWIGDERFFLGSLGDRSYRIQAVRCNEYLASVTAKCEEKVSSRQN